MMSSPTPLSGDAGYSRPQVLPLKRGRELAPHERLDDFMCLCTKAPKIPRPRNAFILYRQHHQAQVALENPGLANPEISKVIGDRWNSEVEQVKARWRHLASEEKARHAREYPGYRYQPRRGGKPNGNDHGHASAEDPGRCQQCGGRFITTPTSPTHPPSIAAGPGPGPAYMRNLPPFGGSHLSRMPTSRTFESAHSQGNHGLQVGEDFSHNCGRRHSQPDSQEYSGPRLMHDDPRQPVKRRRFDHHPEQARQHAPYGNRYMPQNGDLIPRRPAFEHSPPPSTKNQASHLVLEPRLQGTGPGDINFQPASPTTTCSRTVSRNSQEPGPEHSLRLPPIHTILREPQAFIPDEGHLTYAKSVATLQAPAEVEGAPGLPRFSRTPFLPQYLTRLELLRNISPPIAPDATGSAAWQTRGPIIAVESGSEAMSKRISAAVERALSASGGCAVKNFSGDDLHPQEAAAITSPNAQSSEQPTASPKPGQPISVYLAAMIQWHHLSEEITGYVTHQPASRDPSNSEHDCLAERSRLPTPRRSSAGSSQSPTSVQKTPVAILGSGYSLTNSERYAATLPITSHLYNANDHWAWMASLWRDTVGPDLTIYVRTVDEGHAKTHHCVQFANNYVMVVNLVGDAENPEAGLDEQIERRLGFEITEWLRVAKF